MTDPDKERMRQTEFARQLAAHEAHPDPERLPSTTAGKPSGARTDNGRTFSANFDGRRDGKVIARISEAVRISGLEPGAWAKRALDRTAAAEINKATQASKQAP